MLAGSLQAPCVAELGSIFPAQAPCVAELAPFQQGIWNRAQPHKELEQGISSSLCG